MDVKKMELEALDLYDKIKKHYSKKHKWYREPGDMRGWMADIPKEFTNIRPSKLERGVWYLYRGGQGRNTYFIIKVIDTHRTPMFYYKFVIKKNEVWYHDPRDVDYTNFGLSLNRTWVIKIDEFLKDRFFLLNWSKDNPWELK